MWVPGHSGIAGNESADILANIGRASPYMVIAFNKLQMEGSPGTFSLGLPLQLPLAVLVAQGSRLSGTRLTFDAVIVI